MFNRPANGVTLMLLAVLSFSVMEVFAKLVSARVDIVQVLWFRNAVQLSIVLILVAPRLRYVARTKYPKIQVLRTAFMLSATGSFFLSFQKNTLIETNAIAQTGPLWITIGAVLILGERIGRIIIRPGTADFSVWLLLPVLGALFYAGYALATRFIGHDEDVWTSLLYTSLIATALLTIAAPLYWETPALSDLPLLLGVGLTGALAQLFLTTAFARSEASTLAPLSYTALIFSASWGVIFFGNYPDGATYLGALVIVAAGLYVWHRERQQ